MSVTLTVFSRLRKLMAYRHRAEKEALKWVEEEFIASANAGESVTPTVKGKSNGRTKE